MGFRPRDLTAVSAGRYTKTASAHNGHDNSPSSGHDVQDAPSRSSRSDRSASRYRSRSVGLIWVGTAITGQTSQIKAKKGPSHTIAYLHQLLPYYNEISAPVWDIDIAGSEKGM